MQGIEINIDVFGFGFTDRSQTVKTCSINFRRADNSDTETRYEEMIGFENVFCALSVILNTAKEIAESVGADLIISECATEKRARVYAKIAKIRGYKSELYINEYITAVKIFLN